MINCPDCGKAVHEAFKYCLYCGIKLDSNLVAIKLSKLFGNVETGLYVHQKAQDRLRQVGKELGFRTKKERSTFVDILWLSPVHTEFAFQITAKEHNLDKIEILVYKCHT
jgi:hypothetical protein